MEKHSDVTILHLAGLALTRMHFLTASEGPGIIAAMYIFIYKTYLFVFIFDMHVAISSCKLNALFVYLTLT